MFRFPIRLALAGSVALMLASCAEERARVPARALAPVPAKTVALMSERGMDRNAPVLIRAYKKESEIEVWKQSRSGEYVLLKTYPVCRWSGQLGPKTREGDRQVPEGFYAFTPAHMNPNSSYWLSFNVGYPNPKERAMGRTGGDIMVHGTCSSRGCFAMTNDQMEEIYAVVRDAFQGGQKSIQFQSYPFRMTAENLARFRHDPNMTFWQNLKEGNDHFEVTKREPSVAYCGKRYVFNASAEGGRFEPTGPCPSYTVEPGIVSAVDSKRRSDEMAVAALVERGTPAVRIQYSDGHQHPYFRAASTSVVAAEGPVVAQASRRRDLGEISRPEAIESVSEIHLDIQGRPKSPAVASKPEPAVTAAVQASAAPVKSAVAKAETADGGTGASGGLFSGLSSSGSIFGRSAPAAASPAPAIVADEPFYKRMIRFGEPVPAADLPARAPLPPRRQAHLEANAVR
jgi:murein L,D-transpeptidase YafK